LWVEGENLFPDNWIYVHSPDVRFGRVTNFNNWSPTSKNSRRGTVICLEYWCSNEDDLWTWTDEQMGGFAQKEWRVSKIAPHCGSIRDFKVIKLPRSYPVFKVGYKEHLAVIKNYLKQAHPQLCTIGRYGAFKYNNQDHSILMGLRAASLYLRQSKEETESVNSDKNYEEDFELADVRYDAFDEI
jgi:protoporphyrinogen oxidase